MHVLISHDDFSRRMLLKIAFKKAGFLVTSTSDLSVADMCIRNSVVDVLVCGEQVGGKLTHALALLAECRNRLVETILLTSRSDSDVEELFSLIPSLHGLISPDTSPKLITKIALAAVEGATDRSLPITLPSSCRIDVLPDSKIEALRPPHATLPVTTPVTRLSQIRQMA